MHFALMIYYSPEEFALRKNDYNDPHLGAWHKSQSKTRRPLSAMSIRTCSSRLTGPRWETRDQSRPNIAIVWADRIAGAKASPNL